jgi:AraC-like DNA-binding protein
MDDYVLIPRLLLSYLFDQVMGLPKGRKLESRVVLDWEIELILEGGGAQVIEGRLHEVKRGDIVVRAPGERTQGIMPYSCMCAILDMSGIPLERPAPYRKAFLDKEGTWEPQAIARGCPLVAIQGVRSSDSFDLLRGVFERLLSAEARGGPHASLLCSSILSGLLYELLSEASEPFASRCAVSGQDELRGRLRPAFAMMRERYRENIGVGDIARAVGLSKSRFHELFKAATSKSPHEQLMALRLEAAKGLLAATSMSIEDIAIECGFENPPYFFTFFKRALGETPGEFRKRHRIAP